MASFRYSTANDKTYIMMVVETNGQSILYPMLLDTGADRTIFPGSFATFIGHNNLNPKVIREKVSGVGGKASAYIHTLGLSLVDPNKPFIVTKGIKTPRSVWHSSIATFRFVHGFSCQFGLLGRDVIREWKKISFAPVGIRWDIDISV